MWAEGLLPRMGDNKFTALIVPAATNGKGKIR